MPGIDPSNERAALEAIAADPWSNLGGNAAGARYASEIFARSWRGTSCLELGPADGMMAERIISDFTDVTLLDGSEIFCQTLRERFPTANVVCELFEEYRPDRTFDNIVMGHVLEHVDDPLYVLIQCLDWLAPDGRLFAAVPNARSVHRQAAVVMGLLDEETQMNDADRHHGHRRVYTPEAYRATFLRAGWQIEAFGGYWLKPVSNQQIDESWSPEMLEAFMRLGERYPDIAAEIYVVAHK